MAQRDDRITANPKQCGRRPCLRGMRTRVTDLPDMLTAEASREEMPRSRGRGHRRGSAVRQPRPGPSRHRRVKLAVILSKDADLVEFDRRNGPPPHVLGTSAGTRRTARCATFS